LTGRGLSVIKPQTRAILAYHVRVPLLQNSRQTSVAPFLRGAWLLIAGVLLLGYTPALADSYIKVWEKGVIYYYSSGRKPSQPGQAKIITPGSQRVRPTPPTRGSFPEAKAFSREADQPHNLRPLLIEAVTRMESNRSPNAAPDLRGLRLAKANDSQDVNSSDLQENMWTGPRYLGRLLAILGYRSPLASAAHHLGSRPQDCQPDFPPIQDLQASVRDACHNYLKYAKEEQPLMGRAPSGADLFVMSNDPVYCFPVAPPYTFRDSWGDPRSGGRLHHAVDIVAAEGTPVYAITAGVIHTLATWPGAGISLLLQGQDGRGYGYMHLHAYAEGIVPGKTVRKGELIAYVGRTGINYDGPHLHLQVYADHQFDRAELLNPYGLLVQLCNGKGVTDLGHPNLARQRIPIQELLTYGTVDLSNSLPPGYRINQRRAKNAGVMLTHTY
jgi:murein DD-endopeptidase MepM/ murein hydrolase activator NlpD